MAQKTEAEFEQFLKDLLYLDVRRLSNGLWTCIFPLLYTHAIITVRHGDEVGMVDRWCYHSYEAAKKAIDAWNGKGEPEGWHRHPMTGRRRDEEGKEYINF